MNKKRILIIEDDLDLVEAMKVMLQVNNYDVIAAYHPDEGLQKLKENRTDLVILDVMFGSNKKAIGFDYAVKMKQDEELAHIPILMVTSVNVEHPGFGFSDRSSSEFLPVDDFIDKPAQPDDLLNRVNCLLERKTSKWVNWPDMN